MEAHISRESPFMYQYRVPLQTAVKLVDRYLDRATNIDHVTGKFVPVEMLFDSHYRTVADQYDKRLNIMVLTRGEARPYNVALKDVKPFPLIGTFVPQIE